eukprot:TRINITY_DN1226_c0_g1_i2.p1 TRINITY_DN1226_c0_g1~~TRINITY_DN1226_c0_g1_i2.p1  ORF type:complete len:378 (+),score=195.70 TRINITY_DN1226_c0_g1_i2:49-1182(+)
MSLRLGDYLVEKKVIGSGTWASVMRGTHVTTQTPVAIKVMPKFRHNKPDPTPKNEIEALSQLQQIKGVVKVYDVYEDAKHFFLVMEYLPETLLTWVSHKGSMQEDRARYVFLQLVEIVDQVHKLKYTHRDIKLENVLFNPDNWEVKLIDFGMCTKFSDYNHNLDCELVGSPGYIAPEILGKISGGYNGIKSDVYSLGVLLYTCLFGLFPFKDKDNMTYYANKKFTAPDKGASLGFTERQTHRAVPRRESLAFPNGASIQVRSLLHHMLTTDFVKRASVTEIKKHSWCRELPGSSQEEIAIADELEKNDEEKFSKGEEYIDPVEADKNDEEFDEEAEENARNPDKVAASLSTDIHKMVIDDGKKPITDGKAEHSTVSS